MINNNFSIGDLVVLNDTDLNKHYIENFKGLTKEHIGIIYDIHEDQDYCCVLWTSTAERHVVFKERVSIIRKRQ